MDMILKNTFQSISPAYELIGDVTVGSNTTQVDFTGLDIGKDDELLLTTTIINPTGSTTRISLYFNDNTTATNYYQQFLDAETTNISANRENLAGFSYIYSGNTDACTSKIKLTNSGYIVWNVERFKRIAIPTVSIANSVATSTFTSSAITKVRLLASVSNAIGTGSRFQLYKLVAEKVADIIVPSNTTSVDITGLNIGKDGEYYLSSYVANGAGATSAFQFSLNDLAQTSFYYQQIDANATGVSAERANQARFSNMVSSGACLTNSNIKLTNSGYGVIQANTSRYIGGSSITLYKSYMTTTSILSAVTKLTILATVTNGIGANSRFTLYKMK